MSLKAFCRLRNYWLRPRKWTLSTGASSTSSSAPKLGRGCSRSPPPQGQRAAAEGLPLLLSSRRNAGRSRTAGISLSSLARVRSVTFSCVCFFGIRRGGRRCREYPCQALGAAICAPEQGKKETLLQILLCVHLSAFAKPALSAAICVPELGRKKALLQMLLCVHLSALAEPVKVFFALLCLRLDVGRTSVQHSPPGTAASRNEERPSLAVVLVVVCFAAVCVVVRGCCVLCPCLFSPLPAKRFRLRTLTKRRRDCDSPSTEKLACLPKSTTRLASTQT